MLITTLLVVIGFIALIAMLGDVDVMPEKEFQDKVIKGVDALTATQKKTGEEVTLVKSNQEKLLSDVSRLDGETKKALEDLTKVKNTCNDLAAVTQKLQRVQMELRREERMAFGSPSARIVANPEYRACFNVLIRQAMNENGDLNHAIDMHKKALSEGSSPGSIMVTTELQREIYNLLISYGAWRTLDVVRMSTKSMTLPIRTARAVALIIDEASQISDDSNIAGTSKTLTAKKIAVMLHVSRELLQDGEYDVTGDVLDNFAEAVAYRLDHLAFVADGTADSADGSMTGLFEFGTAANAAGGNTTVEKLQLEDFIRCLTTVGTAVLQRAARWWMHQQMLARICTVRDANNRAIFQTALEAPSPTIGSILGYPVVPVGVANSTNAASSKVAAFGDPKTIAVGVRQDIEIATSDHFKWDYDQRSFRGIARAGVVGRVATGAAILTTAAN